MLDSCVDAFIQKQSVFASASFWSYATLLKGPCTTHQLSRYSWRISKYQRANWEHFKVLYRSWVTNITIVWHCKIWRSRLLQSCLSSQSHFTHAKTGLSLMLMVVVWTMKKDIFLWFAVLFGFGLVCFSFFNWRKPFSCKNNLSSCLNFLFCEGDMHYQISSAGYLPVLPPSSSPLLLFSASSFSLAYISWSRCIYFNTITQW